MKVVIAGGRTFKSRRLTHRTLIEYQDSITTVLCGMAGGADEEGYVWARMLDIPVDEYPADWDGEGKKAGYLRNMDMGNDADGLIAFWDGKSKGTKHMINYMTKLEKPITVFHYVIEGKNIRIDRVVTVNGGVPCHSTQ